LKEVELKYGFPLFTRAVPLVNLGKGEKIVISDLWAFWDYVVKKASKDKKEEVFLSSLLEQAKHFYITAESSPIKSQPLLYYYSFLNFAKIIINLSSKPGARKSYYHGMKDNSSNSKFSHSKITKQEKKVNIVHVAHELISIFNPNTPVADVEIEVKDLLNHCVGVHRAFSEIYNQSEIFTRIENYKLYKEGKDLIFKAQLVCKSEDIPSLQAQNYQIDQNEDGIFYIEKISMATYSPTRKDYAQLSRTIHSKGIWYFVGNSGYTLYLSNSSVGRYDQESIIYMVMFYLGSITRYHPYLFDEIFSDKEQWLVSEFLNTQPKQFLYLATARILGQSVYKAYASF
jgi:hypothetical protein